MLSMFVDLDDDAKRQYIDSTSVFTAMRRAREAMQAFAGNMYWKKVGKGEYLVRATLPNSQKGLGPRSPETQAIYDAFVTRKLAARQRYQTLTETVAKMKRLNRALRVGHVPPTIVNVLNAIDEAGWSEGFTVIGSPALYAYETAAGVRISAQGASVTTENGPWWSAVGGMCFFSDLELSDESLLGVLKRVDPTFRLTEAPLFTAQNDKGFAVDMVRSESVQGGSNPINMWVGDENRYPLPEITLLGLAHAPRFSSIIVSTSGAMAQMTTIAPQAFSRFMRGLAAQDGRGPLLRSRDLRKAEWVEALVERYLPPSAAPVPE